MKYKISDIIPELENEESVKQEFIQQLQEYFKCKGIIPVVNGTVAIEVALRALKIPVGKSVIVPDISFLATATAVANVGLIPVFADVSEQHFGLTLENIKKVFVENEVSAVIVVHFAGIVNREIFEIRDFCNANGIFLIEDCAQAFPCHINNQRVGTIGDIGTFSFQSSKIINCGEGGLIVTKSDALRNSCEEIINWGADFHYTHRNLSIPSSNFRLSALQCHFLSLQLKNISSIVKRKLALKNNILELLEAMGIVQNLPDEIPEALDCPFFIIIKSTKKIHTLEPRGEYPMRFSKIVKSIITTNFPSNLDPFIRFNNLIELSSVNVIRENDFVYLRDLPIDKFINIFEGYISYELANTN